MPDDLLSYCLVLGLVLDRLHISVYWAVLANDCCRNQLSIAIFDIRLRIENKPTIDNFVFIGKPHRTSGALFSGHNSFHKNGSL